MLDTDVASVAALIADRGRAAMLQALLDGRALAAGELAKVAGVTPATASAHLGKLQEGGLVTAVRQGRHRYYRLSGSDVAEALESLALIGPPIEVRSLRQSREADALTRARSCYDHLAGRAGVWLHDALVDRDIFAAGYGLTPDGEVFLKEFGIDVPELRGRRRQFAGPCLDRTERRPHLGGALGAALMGRLLDLAWLERTPVRRALRITPAGHQGLKETFGETLD